MKHLNISKTGFFPRKTPKAYVHRLSTSNDQLRKQRQTGLKAAHQALATVLFCQGTFTAFLSATNRWFQLLIIGLSSQA